MNLTTLARHALTRGHTPAATYALLTKRSGKPLPSARAVCLALTIPLAETTRRLTECHDALLTDPRPGAETDTGEVLEALGIFDVPKSLTDTELTYALTQAQAQAAKHQKSAPPTSRAPNGR
ncbi:hypothetical protein ACIQOW_03145 [Kitasatospora sp. NPDC091335]|uniref:hypothetical protein n=1 Tax=Kitasatospora sp. NPDC091335 TaxID=3364085 RepID=UPI0037F962C8